MTDVGEQLGAGARVGFGIDIGGTGMKAATVDLGTGELSSDRYRIDTPRPATPAAMAEVVSDLVQHFDWSGPLGVAFPAVVRSGVVHSAANISDEWIGVNAAELFGGASGCPVHVLNDADAAGVAEIRFGAGRGRTGVVIVLTFGTGIGSGFFVDGHLAANSELGHLEVDGIDAELRAAASARGRDGLSWEAWAGRVQRYLTEVVKLFSPELIVVGGGASKKPDKWLPYIDVGVEIAVASMANSAGIVGAALTAPDA
jgi:polyphosphate glucokinase